MHKAVRISFSVSGILLSYRFHRPGGISYDQFCVEQKRSDRDLVPQAFQRIISAFAKLQPVLAHRGQRR